MTSESLQTLLERALQGCYKGMVTPELKTLYKAPYRNQIDWVLFPAWARIDLHTEGGHEG